MTIEIHDIEGLQEKMDPELLRRSDGLVKALALVRPRLGTVVDKANQFSNPNLSPKLEQLSART